MPRNSKEYKAKAIIGISGVRIQNNEENTPGNFQEDSLHLLVDWEGTDKATNQPYEPTWEPIENISHGLLNGMVASMTTKLINQHDHHRQQQQQQQHQQQQRAQQEQHDQERPPQNTSSFMSYLQTLTPGRGRGGGGGARVEDRGTNSMHESFYNKNSGASVVDIGRRDVDPDNHDPDRSDGIPSPPNFHIKVMHPEEEDVGGSAGGSAPGEQVTYLYLDPSAKHQSRPAAAAPAVKTQTQTQRATTPIVHKAKNLREKEKRDRAKEEEQEMDGEFVHGSGGGIRNKKQKHSSS